MDCVIRVRYNKKWSFVLLKEEELTSDVFLKKAVATFDMDVDRKTARLRDNLGVEIPEALFSLVVKTFHRSASFFIDFECRTNNAIPIPFYVTPEDLQKYIAKQGDASYLFTQFEEMKYSCAKNQKTLIKLVCEFLVTNYGDAPNAVVMDAASQSCSILFPYLSPESLYKSGTKGLLTSRLTYLRSRKNMQLRIEKDAQPVSEDQPTENVPVVATVATVATEEEVQSAMIFLESVVVNKINYPMIRQSLQCTRAHRLEMLQNKKVDVLESFKYFFTDPEVLLTDFLDGQQAKTDALMEKWPAFKIRLNDIKACDYNSIAALKNWSGDISSFLVLLKSMQNATKPRVTFENLIKALIVFDTPDVPVQEYESKEYKYPYIVAYGQRKQKISKFYIIVESHMMDVPANFSFIQTFDLWYKLHYVFHLEFNPVLKPDLTDFVNHYAYQMEKYPVTPTSSMITMFNKMTV